MWTLPSGWRESIWRPVRGRSSPSVTGEKTLSSSAIPFLCGSGDPSTSSLCMERIQCSNPLLRRADPGSSASPDAPCKDVRMEKSVSWWRAATRPCAG